MLELKKLYDLTECQSSKEAEETLQGLEIGQDVILICEGIFVNGAVRGEYAGITKTGYVRIINVTSSTFPDSEDEVLASVLPSDPDRALTIISISIGGC